MSVSRNTLVAAHFISFCNAKEWSGTRRRINAIFKTCSPTNIYNISVQAYHAETYELPLTMIENHHNFTEGKGCILSVWPAVKFLKNYFSWCNKSECFGSKRQNKL